MDPFQRFIQLIKEEDFYEAHEVLEEVWFPFRRSEEARYKVIKGFINASVAFELKRLGREENAHKVWRNYLKYRPLIKEVDEPILYEIEEFLDACYARFLS